MQQPGSDFLLPILQGSFEVTVKQSAVAAFSTPLLKPHFDAAHPAEAVQPAHQFVSGHPT
jgi:hypothetical protein